MMNFDSPSSFYLPAIKNTTDVRASVSRHHRSTPGALFISTYPSRTPRDRMSSVLKPLESASSKRVRIKAPVKTGGSAHSGRIRLIPLPLRNSDSTPIKNNWTTPEGKKEYLDYLKTEIERKKSERKIEEKELKSPNAGLVPIMNQYRRPHRNEVTGEILNHKLPSTDVTNNSVRSSAITAKRLAYFEELEKQTKERKQDEKVRRERERNEAHKHYEAWANLWGRPGNGAPKTGTNHKKENLWRLLLNPKIFENKN